MARTASTGKKRRPGRPPGKQKNNRNKVLVKNEPQNSQDKGPEEVVLSTTGSIDAPVVVKKKVGRPRKERTGKPERESSELKSEKGSPAQKPVMKNACKELSKSVKKLKRKYQRLLEEEVAARKRYKKAKGTGKIDKDALDELKATYRSIRDKADLLYTNFQIAKKEKKKMKKALKRTQK